MCVQCVRYSPVLRVFSVVCVQCCVVCVQCCVCCVCCVCSVCVLCVVCCVCCVCCVCSVCVLCVGGSDLVVVVGDVWSQCLHLAVQDVVLLHLVLHRREVLAEAFVAQVVLVETAECEFGLV